MDNSLYTYKAKVLSVYDGDSLRLDIDLGFKVVMQNQRVRLLGIDTPEVRGEEREAR
jgi:micrococcal nuclease